MNIDGFPGCCSVSVVYDISIGATPKPGYPLDYGSKHFVVVVAEYQQEGFNKLCAEHTLISTSPPFMGNHGKKLSVCTFKIGTGKKS